MSHHIKHSTSSSGTDPQYDLTGIYIEFTRYANGATTPEELSKIAKKNFEHHIHLVNSFWIIAPHHATVPLGSRDISAFEKRDKRIKPFYDAYTALHMQYMRSKEWFKDTSVFNREWPSAVLNDLHPLFTHHQVSWLLRQESHHIAKSIPQSFPTYLLTCDSSVFDFDVLVDVTHKAHYIGLLKLIEEKRPLKLNEHARPAITFRFHDSDLRSDCFKEILGILLKQAEHHPHHLGSAMIRLQSKLGFTLSEAGTFKASYHPLPDNLFSHAACSRVFTTVLRVYGDHLPTELHKITVPESLGHVPMKHLVLEWIDDKCRPLHVISETLLHCFGRLSILEMTIHRKHIHSTTLKAVDLPDTLRYLSIWILDSQASVELPSLSHCEQLNEVALRGIFDLQKQHWPKHLLALRILTPPGKVKTSAKDFFEALKSVQKLERIWLTGFNFTEERKEIEDLVLRRKLGWCHIDDHHSNE